MNIFIKCSLKTKLVQTFFRKKNCQLYVTLKKWEFSPIYGRCTIDLHSSTLSLHIITFCEFFVCLFVCFRAAPVTYGGSQARDRI